MTKSVSIYGFKIFHTINHQYEYKHLILIFGYRRSYDTPSGADILSGRANKLSYRTNAGFSFCLQAWCVIGPTTYPKINIQCLNALRSALHLVQNTTFKYLCQSNHRINAQNIFLNKKPIYLLKDTPYFMNNVLGLSCFILCNILYV